MTPTPNANNSVLDDNAVADALASTPVDVAGLRRTLQSTQDAQNERFLQGEFVADLVQARTRAVDALLHRLWQHFEWPAEAALVAVGGYGRGELLPHSDIDLLLLFRHEGDIDAHVTSVESFITLLWDLSLDIGHSVRTLNVCIEEAREDLTVVTNLLEARLLNGDATLVDEMTAATNARHIWPSEHFYKAKLNEQVHRYQKYGDTGYNLEPNIKSSPGGLRDIQTIGWVVKR
ncbi:MAG: nucleotidyltransferase domain-containing protein, partial [Natronospirillum sp.]